MFQPNSVRAVLLDDDDLARLGGASLLARDLRTSVLYHCASPEELMSWLLRQPTMPDVILLDMEYRSATYPLEALLIRLEDFFPEVKIVGLTQYGEQRTLEFVSRFNLAGLLLKSEVSLSLATAVVNAVEADFVCTHKIKTGLEDIGYRIGEKSRVQESWRLHPELTPRLQDVFWLCLVYGLSARMAANKMYVAYSSVERYRQRIYQIMSDDYYYDDSSLAAWKHLLHKQKPENLSDRRTGFWGNEWAYQVMTIPPRPSG